jgi:hypothetical protein
MIYSQQYSGTKPIKTIAPDFSGQSSKSLTSFLQHSTSNFSHSHQSSARQKKFRAASGRQWAPQKRPQIYVLFALMSAAGKTNVSRLMHEGNINAHSHLAHKNNWQKAHVCSRFFHPSNKSSAKETLNLTTRQIIFAKANNFILRQTAQKASLLFYSPSTLSKPIKRHCFPRAPAFNNPRVKTSPKWT